MPSTTFLLLSALALATSISAHGQISKPSPRLPGTAMATACGQQLYSQQSSDMYGNVQGELQIAASQSDYDAEACHVWLCKGYQFADVPAANVQSYKAGEVVPITVDIRAPHTGTCNVSVVSTKSNTMISEELIYFDVYASNAQTIPANNTQFSVTMPDLGDQCATAGDCVLQWYWNAADIDQTYESCVDFTMGGSGAASSAVASVTPVVASSTTSSTTTASSSSTTPSSLTVVKAPSTSTSTTVIPTTFETMTTSTSSTTPAQEPTVASSSFSITATATSTATASAAPSAVPDMPAGTTLSTLIAWTSAMVKKMLG